MPRPLLPGYDDASSDDDEPENVPASAHGQHREGPVEERANKPSAQTISVPPVLSAKNAETQATQTPPAALPPPVPVIQDTDGNADIPDIASRRQPQAATRAKPENEAGEARATPQPPPAPLSSAGGAPAASKRARRHQRRARSRGGGDAHGVPAELSRELSRTGHTLQDVEFVDVDARASALLPVRASAARADASAVAARAGRIAKRAAVSRTERRKHQITALAADAAALAAARESLGVNEAARPRGRRR